MHSIAGWFHEPGDRETPPKKLKTKTKKLQVFAGGHTPN